MRVIEVGGLLPAAYCGKLLADMGADVIKVEEADGGDELRRHGPFPQDQPHPEGGGLFLYLNAGKRGITLNLRTATGRALLEELAVRSDVLVHTLHPSLAEEMGLAYGRLSQANAGLVMAAITPFGQGGPYRDYKGYDINITAASGVSQGIGRPEREPLSFPLPQSGYFAGMCVASATVVALLARDESGQGQLIDIAEAECLAGLYTGPEALMEVYDWRVTRRTAHHALDFPYPNCILRCQDGYIFVGAAEGRQWRRLLELMGSPPWAQDPRFRNRTEMNNLYADEVDAYMEEWLCQHTKAELLHLALEHRIPLAPVRDFREVAEDPSLADFFVTVERGDTGPLTFPGLPYILPEAAPRPPQPAPLLGQHNQEVLCGLLGHPAETLTRLYQQGVV